MCLEFVGLLFFMNIFESRNAKHFFFSQISGYELSTMVLVNIIVLVL